MNGKAGFSGYFVATVAVAVGVSVLLAGCQKDKPMAGTDTQAMQTKSPTAPPAPMKHEATPAPVTQVAQTAEQTTCPVMGGKIDKNVFVEYKGKKVYFCCNGCPDVFKADPAKYISKLPQFAK